MPTNSTTWSLERHTLGKHLVLQHYMDAWLPIMTRYNGRVLFIDAFAGPGEYSAGEEGSPIIALKALTKHSVRDRMNAEIRFLFIEKDGNRANHLKQVLEGSALSIPQNCSYQVLNSSFDDTLTGVLNRLDEQQRSLAPSFVMIDPFGVSGTPMKTIARILANPKSEVYVSVMYDAINRHKDHEHFESHLDELFGCPDWREGIDMPDARERKDFFFDLYKQQLRASGAKYVLHFELYEGQRLIYAIFFGTQNSEGCDKMKQAIWKVVPFGDYRFFGGRIGQLTFAEDLDNFTPFENDLCQKFSDQEWITIKEVIEFSKSDQTDFHSSH